MPTASIHVLPEQEEYVEALQGLAQETRQAQGEAMVMPVEQFEGLTGSQVIERYQQARTEEFCDLRSWIVYCLI